MENIKVKLPTTVVVFGGTGDLSKRKLLPAFFSLYSKDILPDKFRLIGVSRSKREDGEFKDIIKDSVTQHSKYKEKVSDEKLNVFADLACYLSGKFESLETYKKLAEHLLKIDESLGVCSNKLFYLAVPPENYEIILKNLDKSGLTIPCSKKEGWTRVLIEKPFGSNYETAEHLDKLLGDLFLEEQIFRIDHYLAKETIQNILTFRFTNALFEPIWNNEHIEKMEIKLLEKLDVSTRGAFYDGIGALRDVGQNHILQILASMTMENPKILDAKYIREKRAELLFSLRPISKKDISKFVIKGQYEGYKKEEGVKDNSDTETYFKLKTFIDNKRWEGVPFILESGKALSETKTEVKIYFKEQKPCFCVSAHKEHKHQNIITFRIQPKESIYIDFFIKKPSLIMDYQKKELCFEYGGDVLSSMMPDAYEKILFDCMMGDQTLFTNTKEIMASWKFITSILEVWKDITPTSYEKGGNSSDFNFSEETPKK
jgi:glucose-6-phosphate 1-dehydrogenase